MREDDFIAFLENVKSLLTRKSWTEISREDLFSLALPQELKVFLLSFSPQESLLLLLFNWAEKTSLPLIASPHNGTKEPKDVLFESIICFLDQLIPARSILKQAYHAKGLGCLSLTLGRRLNQYSQATLLKAGISPHDFSGNIRCYVFLGVFLDTMRYWLEDETPGQEKALAHLDQRLNQASFLLSMLSL